MTTSVRNPMLHVFAAGSLRPAFERLAPAAFTYANARDLALRIEAGAPADVFASASPEHPRRLHAAGLLGEPRPFATNRVVIAVPTASDAHDLTVLTAPGARLVIEVAGVPLGDYTRAILSARDLANVVFEETIVDAVADRILAGEADAGILYATDVAARAGRLRAIELPTTVQPTYVAGVVTRSLHQAAAAAWIDALVGAPALTQAGFGPPP